MVVARVTFLDMEVPLLDPSACVPDVAPLYMLRTPELISSSKLITELQGCVIHQPVDWTTPVDGQG